MVPIVGDINEEIPYELRDTGTIYIQKDDLNDYTWTMFIWVPPDEETGEDGYWIDLGSTNPDIAQCWTKEEASIEELSRALHLEDKVDRSEFENYTEEEILTIINEAKANTIDVYDE